ncbi:substrate-binding domain-containing protein [Haploplasma axanthum]|uniref:D-galactose/ D-glucose-binding protein n=1 Tax=Haploplasma axanthum TaxID=29552 RepID=A0A449BBN6_HAPAX|nr:substrate-binding domain-containing protein [Haploplasma axanthum]VEU79857.1 D-galactose/ D-glucose-binding protein [Haploplasma axanthum]
MKRVIKMMLLVLITIIISGCSKGRTKKIGILIYDKEDTFMQEYLSELTKKIDQKSNFKYEVYFAGKNQLLQNKQFLEFYNEDYDLIIVNAVDRLSSYAMIEKAEVKDIPLIFINREPQAVLSNSKNSYYVGSNSLQIGVLQAELVKQMLDTNDLTDINDDGVVQIVILKGEQSHQDAENRTAEVINGLKDLGINYEILTISIGNWERNQVYLKADELFSEYDNVELVISNNDDMALGIIDYLEEKEFIVAPKIIGVDGTVAGLEAIANNKMYGTVVNDYLEQVRTIDILIDYLLKGVILKDFDYDNRFQLINGKIIHN